MRRTPIIIVSLMIVAACFIGCGKTPDGVINEDDMAHVLADFAKAEQLISQYPDLFPDDSSKLLLKQSILKKYGADLAMYDSSLVWYAHNLNVYSQVHDKAIEIIEKESNNGKTTHPTTPGDNYAANNQNNSAKRSFPTSGDSANVWKESQQWILTNAVRDGYIKFDYTPDNDSRKGDKYALCFKMANSGNAISMLVAIDYEDGCTSYINRTAQANGWVENAIQGDSTKVIKRIYGFIRYKTRPHGMTFIDSTYLLRTHYDRATYSTISQRIVGPKAIIEQQNQEAAESEDATTPPLTNQPQNNTSFPGQQQRGTPPPGNYPGRPAGSYPGRPAPNEQGSYKPKPGLNKSSPQRRGVVPNPNGEHLPRPVPTDK